MYDVIVLGLGGMGTAAAAELARRGRRVLGLEQFAPAHDQGSSHGHTRVIRTAYYEHPAYVPLVRRAFQLWHELEQRTGKHLLTACPCLSIGRPGGELIDGVRRAAAEHSLPVENLGQADLTRRFPLFRFDESYVGILEKEAGFLYVEWCVKAAAADAVAHGVTLQWAEPVLEWQATDRGVIVKTDRDTYHANRLVITAGPWAKSLLGDLGSTLTVMRQTPIWLAPSDPRPFARDRFPIFLADTPAGTFYGLPAIDQRGLKVARHYGAPELPGPHAVNRTVTDEDEVPIRTFVREHLPAANGPRTHSSVCLYTLTPDRHFVIDMHPESGNVAIAAGFSGHGFKFAPVVGELLADLVETGKAIDLGQLFRIGRRLKSTDRGERRGGSSECRLRHGVPTPRRSRTLDCVQWPTPIPHEQGQDGQHQEDEEENAGAFPGHTRDDAKARQGGEHCDHEKNDSQAQHDSISLKVGVRTQILTPTDIRGAGGGRRLKDAKMVPIDECRTHWAAYMTIFHDAFCFPRDSAGHSTCLSRA